MTDGRDNAVLPTPAGVKAPYPSEAEARALVQIARDLAGLSLDPGKRDFLRTRLGRLMRERGLESYGPLIAEAGQSDPLRRRILEAFTTHTTSFFRERGHFDHLRQTILPEWAARPVQPFAAPVIWSAACSSGAELWSAAITVAEFADQAGITLPVKLIGSDISHRILRAARGATYAEQEMAGLPADLMSRYFLRAPSDRRGHPGYLYRVKPDLRGQAEFHCINLLQADQQAEFRADVVFLRNVLIYFDVADRERIVRAVLRRMTPGATLFTGHAEALNTRAYGLDQIAPSTFRKSEP